MTFKSCCYCWLVGGGVELAPPLVLPPVQLSEIMSTLVTLNVFPAFAVAAPEELEAAAEAPPSHVPCTVTS